MRKLEHIYKIYIYDIYILCIIDTIQVPDLLKVPSFCRFWCQLTAKLPPKMVPQSITKQSKNHPKSIPISILSTIIFLIALKKKILVFWCPEDSRNILFFLFANSSYENLIFSITSPQSSSVCHDFFCGALVLVAPTADSKQPDPHRHGLESRSEV